MKIASPVTAAVLVCTLAQAALAREANVRTSSPVFHLKDNLDEADGLVVTGPGVKGGRSEAFVATVDLFTTIAGLAGAVARDVDGHDFAPAFAGEETTRDCIYVEHFSEKEPARSDVYGWAIREGDYKLVAEEGVEPVLYDLAADPREAVNLLADGVSSEEAAIVDSIKARWTEIREQ